MEQDICLKDSRWSREFSAKDCRESRELLASELNLKQQQQQMNQKKKREQKFSKDLRTSQQTIGGRSLISTALDDNINN